MDNYKIIRCAHCGQQLRIPSDKEIQVSCPNCKYSFKVNAKEKTFVDELYEKKEVRHPREERFVHNTFFINERLLGFMQREITANKSTRHFTQKLYYPDWDYNKDDSVITTFESYVHSINWTVVKELIEKKIREYNLGIKNFTVTIRNEPCERKIKEDKKDFWGRPKYKIVQDIKHTIWISASW